MNMQLRLRSFIIPLVRGVVLLLRRVGTSPKTLNSFFYLTIIASSGVFLWLLSMPFSHTLLTASMVLIFASGFMEEVRREYQIRDSEFSRYADLILYAGILYYLSQGSYLNFYVSQKGHLLLGGFLVLGMYTLEKALERGVRKGRSPGLEVPSERLLFLTVFAITGYNHKAYEDFLLVGLILLTLVIYSSALYHILTHRGVSISRRKVRAALSRFFAVYLNALDRVKAGVWVLYRVIRRIMRTQPQVRAPVPGVTTATAEPAHGYNFTVIVVDEEEQPVAEARVTVVNVEGSVCETGYTDPQGKCVFSNLPEGQYNLTIEAEGLPEEQFERYINMDSGEVFKLRPLSLDLSVVVSDSVERRPVVDALVTLETADGHVFERRTDNLGVAYFDRLPVGHARLKVEAEGYVTKTRRIDPASENMVSLNLRRRQVFEIPESLLVEYREMEEAGEILNILLSAFGEMGEKPYLVSTGSILREFTVSKVEGLDFSSALPEDIETALGEMPSGGAMIFEAVTELIHRLGLDEALNFMGKLLTFARERNVSFVALINQGIHGERIAAMFEGLFDGVAEYSEGGLVEKGGRS